MGLSIQHNKVDVEIKFKRSGEVVLQKDNSHFGWIIREGELWRFVKKSGGFTVISRSRSQAILDYVNWRNKQADRCFHCHQVFPLVEVVTVKGIPFCKDHIIDPNEIINI